MSKKRYPVRIPRYAAGIRMQESRAGGGRSWWSREWMQRLESMGLKGRLGRGKNYAISGQVVKMEIAENRVISSVVGTRSDPYEVTIEFRMPSADARSRIISAIRNEPMLVARLLADDLPTEIEMLFRAEGFDLFPGAKLAPGTYDVTTQCSCPDYANPCKHSAAVLLVLGEEIARCPATLLALRGIAMEDLCDED